MATLGKSDVHYYNSEMTGAPSLSSTLGGVVNILDACLINGFGSEAAQGHWERPYGTTNKAVYRSTSDKSLGFCLSVDDSVTNGAFYVRGYQDVQGYSGESGVNPFPSIAHEGSGLSCYRMNNGSGTRRWAVYADSCCFYLFIDADVGNQYEYDGSWRGGFFFGDIVPYNKDDAWHCLVVGGSPIKLATLNSTSSSYLAGGAKQVAESTLSFRVSWGNKSNIGQGTQVYPSVADHGFHLWPVEVWDYTASFSDARGMMPGLHNQTHLWIVSSGICYGDHFDVHGNQYRTQMCGGAAYKCVINLTGPWR